MHIGQPIPSPLMTIGQALMVDSKQMQHGCLKIMHVHSILHDIVTKLIGFSVLATRLYSTTSHPKRKASRMMISPKIATTKFTLAIIGSPKLPRPNDKRIV
jgi:hypothetical protein